MQRQSWYSFFREIHLICNYKGEEYKRLVLGGSKEFPYPRRGRTRRHRNKSDPATESRLGLLNLNIYVPRDEWFGSVKMCDMISNGLKSALHAVWPLLKDPFHPSKDFHSFEDVKKLYTANGESLFKFPTPQVIAADKFAWREDEEFTREMLSGVNPLHIRRLHFKPNEHLVYYFPDALVYMTGARDEVPVGKPMGMIFLLCHTE